MRGIIVLFAIVATIAVTSASIGGRNPRPPPLINRPIPPRNPPRYARSADPGDHGSISISGSKPFGGPERRPSYNIDYQHNIWKGKNGQITAGGGASKVPGQRWQPQVGVQGTWRFKREANPDDNNHFSFTQVKPLSGPERRPSYNVDYQHDIFKGKDGHISAGGGAQRLPGGHWEPTIGVQGQWRFKREANPDGDNHISLTQVKPLSGPERRPSYNIDYQHNIFSGKDGHISAGGGAQRLPGGHWEPTIGVQGQWRFKREANPDGDNHISFTQVKPLSGPERRPSYNIDYQHNIFSGKDGHISAGGGAQRLPGGHWEPTIGVQGQWRFKREANPDGDNHISFTQVKPLSGPERRPSYNVDYQHNIFSGKDGHVSAGGGAQRLPGGRWEPTIGLQGQWRFKREANPDGDNGSVTLTQVKPLSGPERRPYYNVDYQQNIYKGKDGHVSAGGGAQKLPGGRWEPTVGVQAQWNW